jgi:hypothetical protein
MNSSKSAICLYCGFTLILTLLPIDGRLHLLYGADNIQSLTSNPNLIDTANEDLYQLFISTDDDLHKIEKLPIHYYGQFQSEPSDFILISIDPLKINIVDKLKFNYRRLTSSINGKTFYWIYPTPIKSLPDALLSLGLVFDQEGVLVNISGEEAELLLKEGFSIRLMVPLPKGLLSIPRYPLRTIKDVTPKPLVQDILNQVKEAVVYNYTGDLTGMWPVMIDGMPYTISTRNSYESTGVTNAAQYLYDFYRKLGLDVSFEEFTCWGTAQRNIIAKKKGSVFRERVFAITSHYDTMPRNDPAPGADDNASGTVAVMLAAELLGKYDFANTLHFIHFACEEQGLGGSFHHARKSYCGGEDLQAVVNLDMIAWNTLGTLPEMDIQASPAVPASLDLAGLLQNVIQNYRLALIPTIKKTVTGRGDHGSFWNFKFPAIMAIESSGDFNPNYHSIGDNLTSLVDIEYYSDMIKAGIALFAHLGELIEDGWGYLDGTVTIAETGEPLPNVSVSIQNPSWGYTFSTATDNQGRFGQRVVSGIHNVLFKKNGYEPATTSGILVSQNNAATINTSLFPGEFYYMVHLPLAPNNYAFKIDCF